MAERRKGGAKRTSSDAVERAGQRAVQRAISALPEDQDQKAAVLGVVLERPEVRPADLRPGQTLSMIDCFTNWRAGHDDIYLVRVADAEVAVALTPDRKPFGAYVHDATHVLLEQHVADGWVHS